MVFYELYLGGLQTFNAGQMSAWMEGVQLGSGALTGTMDDALYSAGWAGSTPGGDLLISCEGITPSRRLVQVVGAGPAQPRDWQIWRLTDWGDDRPVYSGQERIELESRRQFLEERLAEWDRLRALNPTAVMRPIDDQRQELVDLEWMLSPVGSLFVVAYVGYARRIGRGEYLWQT